ncbi:hypothetical protein QJS10_CPB21g01417 [Acorus calamus]|uniref:Uncharacterized protein n=1 Tax=Acorus calamus TaxID=4465 RepID=A0AAV9C5D6_ACOCL|nr:hypothetical protein QJS10_CPB21g01417 [Acorus calamus]
MKTKNRKTVETRNGFDLVTVPGWDTTAREVYGPDKPGCNKGESGRAGHMPEYGSTRISKDGELQKDKKLFSSVSEDFMVSESMLEYFVESLGFSSYKKPMWVLK